MTPQQYAALNPKQLEYIRSQYGSLSASEIPMEALQYMGTGQVPPPPKSGSVTQQFQNSLAQYQSTPKTNPLQSAMQDRAQMSQNDPRPDGTTNDPNRVLPNPIHVQMTDGSYKTFDKVNQDLADALAAGGRPIDRQGKPMTVGALGSQAFGTPGFGSEGFFVQDEDGNAYPLNVLGGLPWGQDQFDKFGQMGMVQGYVAGTQAPSFGPSTGPPLPGGSGNPGGGTGGTGGTGGAGGTGGSTGPYLGNQGATAPTLPKDLEDALRQLMQEARNQGVRGQEALTGVLGDLRNYLGFTQAGAQSNMQQRDALIQSLLHGTQAKAPGNYPISMKNANGDVKKSTSVQEIGALMQNGYQPMREDGSPVKVEEFGGGLLFDGVPINGVITGQITKAQADALSQGGRQVPGHITVEGSPQAGGGSGLQGAIESALAGMNDNPGFSPEGQAALRLQATEQPQRDYQSQVQTLKEQLGQRGAYGGGDTPGDLGAIVSGYAPLLTSRDQTRSGLLQNAILQTEQRKFDTLGLNRSTAASMAGIGAGLTTGLGNVYNPGEFLTSSNSALGNILNTVNSGTNAGFTGINQAGNIGGTLADLQPASFSNILKSALIGTGVDAAKNIDWGKVASSIASIFKGNNNNNPTVDVGATTPPYQYPG